MPRLALFLLGPPRLERDGVAIRLDRRKATALLAYLAATGQSHRRDSLVNLLWPDLDSTTGRAALRRTLHALSTALGGDCLDADRDQIGLNPEADLWIDAIQFRRYLAERSAHGHPASQLCHACVPPLSAAVGLVRGDFLAGFGLKDSVNFDDWQLLQAESIRRDLAEALDSLILCHSAQREFDAALRYALRRLALDPLDEAAQRQLMRLHAWSGRRAAALRQYEECAAALQDQLGVPPQDATRQLRDEIQAGRTPPLPTALELAAEMPGPLKADRPVESPVFVARERELAQLDRFLDAALAGQGQVVFVTGEAGSGKTALIQAFTSRAQAAHADLVAAGGHGNALTGAGDPYLPFRELLSLLSGDVEAPRAAGAMTQEHARRLWQLLPQTVQALVRIGPDLIGLLLPGESLVERARMIRPWPSESVPISHLQELVAERLHPADTLRLQQSALFEQYTQVLRGLAAAHPLLLTLDDLQWADTGSANLLFHLGRRLGGSRILILGAYRPAEVAMGRPTALSSTSEQEMDEAAERHPLETIVHEFKRAFGAIEIDLERAEGRPFVDALLDSEPNRLSDAFCEALHQRTQGHPLFTIELLRGMQERGDLVHDNEGRWVEEPALDWETLPVRVEAVIAERIGRLSHRLRALLAVASVEGESFAAEAVAQVQGAAVQDVVRSLSEILDRRHRLVSARGMVRVGSQRLSQYRFRHILYQRYLYSTLDQVERATLHEQVGTALERLYADQESAAVAVQLALHFQEAGIAEKAVQYLHQAGQRALQLSAYEEGLVHLTRALALLMTQPGSPERDRQELGLQLALGPAQQGVRGTQATEMRDAYIRARELCLETGEMSHLSRVLGGLALNHYVRAEHKRARNFGEQALHVAQHANDPLLEALSCWFLGVALFCLGDYAAAREYLERVIAFYAPQQHHRAFVVLSGSDAGAGALAYLASTLWCLGYPEQALRRSQEALDLAREMDHPFSLADVLAYGGCLCSLMCRDALTLQDNAAPLIKLSGEKLRVWSGTGEWYFGRALALLGQVQEGLAIMRGGIAVMRSRGQQIGLSAALASLAESQLEAGRFKEGLDTLAEALSFVESSDERFWEAEIERVRAQLLLTQGQEAVAEASLHQAIDIARRQRARSWELRATTSLCRLWQRQGKIGEARQMLGAIYGWFTEGFGTPDLLEAKALLEELTRGAGCKLAGPHPADR